ncbi:putative membrane transporter protein YfcA [Methylobacterium thuringiense]|uniref:Probable membrane transporter protein n=2 Tax=Methylobacteriaceae TaxID=119045 RepID=A0ABQ4TIT1_9HYPH|nr:putative membrane transporter protein YfcA [Methylobacterium thuringiense]
MRADPARSLDPRERNPDSRPVFHMIGGVDTGTLAGLFGIAVVAGCFDAIAGGGGLLTLPALLLAGLDPVSAIATNKLQGSGGSVSASIAFARRGLIRWPEAIPAALAAGAASVAGALCVSLLPKSALDTMVPLLLVGIALYFATARRLGNADATARITPRLFALTLAPAIGFYDGVFGPGAGSFYMIGFVTLLGLGVVRATAHTKLANAASNLGSLALFAAQGVVVWPVGLAMALGAVIGAQAGSALAVKLGARLIRPLLVVIACTMALRLLSDPANPLRRAVLGSLGL